MKAILDSESELVVDNTDTSEYNFIESEKSEKQPTYENEKFHDKEDNCEVTGESGQVPLNREACKEKYEFYHD